jgi:hypothetical protein
MKTKGDTPDGTALSHGERVARGGVFTGRREAGLRPAKGYAHAGRTIGCARRLVRGLVLPISYGTNPSPVVLRLVKAPEADTLSPRERAESRSAPPPAPQSRLGSAAGAPVRGRTAAQMAPAGTRLDSRGRSASGGKSPRLTPGPSACICGISSCHITSKHITIIIYTPGPAQTSQIRVLRQPCAPCKGAGRVAGGNATGKKKHSTRRALRPLQGRWELWVVGYTGALPHNR